MRDSYHFCQVNEERRQNSIKVLYTHTHSSKQIFLSLHSLHNSVCVGLVGVKYMIFECKFFKAGNGFTFILQEYLQKRD